MRCGTITPGSVVLIGGARWTVLRVSGHRPSLPTVTDGQRQLVVGVTRVTAVLDDVTPIAPPSPIQAPLWDA